MLIYERTFVILYLEMHYEWSNLGPHHQDIRLEGPILHDIYFIFCLYLIIGFRGIVSYAIYRTIDIHTNDSFLIFHIVSNTAIKSRIGFCLSWQVSPVSTSVIRAVFTVSLGIPKVL